MHKYLSVLLCFVMLFTFVSCNTKKSYESEKKTPVTINMPNDDTVNGYRQTTPGNDSENNDSDAVKNTGYCGNINSKVFHYSDCKSVAKMKDENKYFNKSRDHFTKLGFTPCKNCKP